MQNIQTLLDDYDACAPAREWASGKTWQTIYDTCERGTRLTWLLSRHAPAGLDERTCVKLAAALANTVRDLMPDASKEALDVAIRYGNGEATDDELEVAADAAAWAAWAAARAARAARAASAAGAVAAGWAVEGAVEGAVNEAAWEASWAARAAAEAGGNVAAACASRAWTKTTASWTADATRAWAKTAAARAACATIERQMANLVREIIPIEYFSIDPNSTYINHDC